MKDPRDRPELTGAFTLVFEGDIRKFDGNPLRTPTPFGTALAVSMGDALQQAERGHEALSALDAILEAGEELAGAAGDIHPSVPSIESIKRLHRAIDAWAEARDAQEASR
jgi:hypothetical protein